MNVIVRAPALTDAVGAGMANRLIDQQQWGKSVDADYWRTHTEETYIERWHRVFSTRKRGSRIALAVSARRTVGITALEPVTGADRSGNLPARPLELTFFAMLAQFYDAEVMQRMFDFVLPRVTPVQCWVLRTDQSTRRFLRVNGFTLDGLTMQLPHTRVEYSRMVR